MSAGVQVVIVGTLGVLLAIVSAVAGALWWRLRSLPVSSPEHLARALAERLHAIQADAESKRAHNGSAVGRQNGVGLAPRAAGRADDASITAPTGPTLIAVPDLAAQHGSHETSSTTSELSRRFGVIWQMADSGASAEQVAQSTGLPVGHIELILGLRRQLEAAAAWPVSGGENP